MPNPLFYQKQHLSYQKKDSYINLQEISLYLSEIFEQFTEKNNTNV